MYVRLVLGLVACVCSVSMSVGSVLFADERTNDAETERDEMQLEAFLDSLDTQRMELEWIRVLHEAGVRKLEVAELELRAQRIRIELDTRQKLALAQNMIRKTMFELREAAEVYQADGDVETANRIRERLTKSHHHRKEHQHGNDSAGRGRRFHQQMREIEEMKRKLYHVHDELERARDDENEAEIHELEVIAEKLEREIRGAEERLHKTAKAFEQALKEAASAKANKWAKAKEKAKKVRLKKSRNDKDLRPPNEDESKKDQEPDSGASDAGSSAS